MWRFHLLAESGVSCLPGLAYLLVGVLILY